MLPELARCERELLEIRELAAQGTHQAWLVMLGTEDWEMEKRIIERDGTART